MVKVDRTFPAPISLAEEAQKVNGSYTKDDVKEMNKLYDSIEEWEKNPDSRLAVREIKVLLRRESSFAAFNRI